MTGLADHGRALALIPEMPVLHANPELAAWHGTVIPADDGDEWHRHGDVHATWIIPAQDGIPEHRVSGWYGSAAVIPETSSSEPEAVPAA